MASRHAMAALSAAIVLSAVAAKGADGILIAQKMTSSSGTVTTHQIQIEKTRMRAETDAAGGRKMTMIFDGAAQVMRTIDDTAKTYTEMTKADLDSMSAQMSGAMAQMQEQMKNMPPETRKRMEALMQGRGVPGAGGGAPTEYKKVGTDKVGKWTCDKYEGTRNGEKVSELCTVAPATLGFGATDFDVTRQMAEFFSKLVPQGADQMFRVGSPAANGFAGLPVRTIIFRDGAPSITSEITDASRQNFPDSLFAVPAGYQKREMMGGRGRGRQ
jgi:uncharacterized protein DUF4412